MPAHEHTGGSETQRGTLVARAFLRQGVLTFFLCTGERTLAVGGARDSDGAGLGYLTAPSASPGHILRPSSLFLQPGNVRKRSFEGSFDLHWANVWCYDREHYLFDGEWIRADTRIQYGLTDSLSAGLVLPVMGRTGGFADSMIEGFHKTFDMDNANREQFPRDRSRVSVTREDGTARNVVAGDSWGVGDVAFFAILKRPDLWVAPSVMIQCSLPTGDEDELEGLGSPSISVSTVGNRRIGKSPVHAFAGVGVSYCPEDGPAGIELNPVIYSGLFGLECHLAPRWSLVTQMLSSSPPAEDFGEFSDSCHELSVGCKWRTGDAAVLELTFVENVLTFDNSSDIAMHFSIGRRL